jgi:UDP-N-acetylglucosamine--N-acetylmuramyl-(pentapeptide) pyrophosphoryl-undecaprenol N-acetylglucosamine transferase
LAIAAATLSAMRYMKQLKVDAVAGFGGYVAGPGGLAARALGIPVIIHEQNAT